jgi:hypothetical protein
MAAPAQLSADQSNKHTEKYQSLYKSWKKRQDGKSSTVMWDYFKPMLIYGDPPAEGQPKPVVGVKVQTLCDKLLSAGNVSDTFSGHKNCQKLGYMFPANRTRLAIAKANKMMLVRNSYRLSKGITLQDKEVERAFWIEDLAEADDDEEVEIVG